jgi:endonuclease/exonuclease/phosphatase family metal-dependent hydrolase
MAILSRRPLRDPSVFDLTRFGLHLRSRCRVALAATIETPFGPLRVFGVHLDTRINFKERAAQLDPVVEAAGRFRGPAVLAGDLNTQPVYWIQHVLPVPYAHNQHRAIRRFLGRHGFSTPLNGRTPTFEPFGFPLDWIYLRSLSSASWGIERIEFSDHRAVWVSRLEAVPEGAPAAAHFAPRHGG